MKLVNCERLRVTRRAHARSGKVTRERYCKFVDKQMEWKTWIGAAIKLS